MFFAGSRRVSRMQTKGSGWARRPDTLETGSGAESVKSACSTSLDICNQAKELLLGGNSLDFRMCRVVGLWDFYGFLLWGVVGSFMIFHGPSSPNSNKARHEMHCGPAFCILVCLHIWSMRVFGFHADCFERTEIS
eukprot:s205_g46.t2